MLRDVYKWFGLVYITIAHTKKWPDPENDTLIFIANPIEANMPGHWVPGSIVKAILERSQHTETTKIEMPSFTMGLTLSEKKKQTVQPITQLKNENIPTDEESISDSNPVTEDNKDDSIQSQNSSTDKKNDDVQSGAKVSEETKDSQPKDTLKDSKEGENNENQEVTPSPEENKPSKKPRKKKDDQENHMGRRTQYSRDSKLIYFQN